jgi:UDP-N-acetylglucosamine 2-epimerase (non-hydrolysing)
MTSRYNLILEDVDQKSIVVTGNTGVSALARWGAEWQARRFPRVLVTMHRREWYLKKGAVERFAKSLAKAADDLEETVVWPVHPAISERISPEVRVSKVMIQHPMSYERFSKTLASSKAVLTDSGGVTEEAAALGVPCAVMRSVTDRPEAEEAEVAARYQNVGAALRWVLNPARTREPSACFGTEDAAERSVAAIRDWFSAT